MNDPLFAAFQLAEAVHHGNAAATRLAAQAVERELGAGTTRKWLRMLHLFFGFPKIVQAFNACSEVLPTVSEGQADPSCVAAQVDRAPDSVQGEHNFRELYAQDADRVLTHLGKLDPCLRAWILDHAYARALLHDGISLAQTERLAVLCLAATGCWKQWESHVAIALRVGVPSATLQADCNAAKTWLGQEASARALTQLKDWRA